MDILRLFYDCDEFCREFVHTLHEALQTERLTIVPYFPAPDPLLHHIALVLQVALPA